MFAILWMVSNLHASNIWSEYKFYSETALNRFDGQDFVVVLLLDLVCFDDDIIFCIPMFLNILPCIYTKLWYIFMFFSLSIYFFRGYTTQLAISNYLLFITLHIFCDISLYWSLLSINILSKQWSLPRE